MSNETAQQTTMPTETQPAPPDTPPSNLPVPAPRAVSRAAVQFDADDPISLYMDTGIFEQLQRVAKMMAQANLVPAHLRGGPDKVADCFLVAAQAFRWRMDPFSVAQHTFVTSGKLGYEGKLIAGLINASGRLETNLKPVYSGTVAGNDRKVTIVGRIRGEAEDRVIDGTVGQWKTSNEKWQTMPDQMLFYRGAREWARRHMPEVMLGISADEEIIETTAIEAPRTLAQLTEKLHAAAQGGADPETRALATTSIPTPAVPADVPKAPFAEAVDAEKPKAKPQQGRLSE